MPSTTYPECVPSDPIAAVTLMTGRVGRSPNASKFTPWSVMVVPPASGPLRGEMREMIGGE